VSGDIWRIIINYQDVVITILVFSSQHFKNMTETALYRVSSKAEQFSQIREAIKNCSSKLFFGRLKG
jgi:hypothetical protein